MEQLWGWHSSFNVSHCDLNKITDRDNIYNFNKRLVQDIDMEAYGEPEIVYFGNGDKSGWTLFQTISTSNICGHFVDEYKALFLDVFSCKSFDANVVVELLKEYFDAKTIIVNSIERKCII